MSNRYTNLILFKFTLKLFRDLLLHIFSITIDLSIRVSIYTNLISIVQKIQQINILNLQ